MTTMAKKDSLNGLRKHFPSLRTREEILEEITANSELSDTFYRWPLENQTEFLECRKLAMPFRENGVPATRRIICCGSISGFVENAVSIFPTGM